MQSKRTNQYREAFRESFNMVGLAIAGAMSAATLDLRPALAAVVLEAGYLLFAADSRWYTDRLKRREAQVEADRRKKLQDETLALLRPEMRERYEQLESLRRQIEAQTADDNDWYRDIIGKLTYLSEKFLVFGAKEVQFQSYLAQLVHEVRSEQGRGGASNDYAQLEVWEKKGGSSKSRNRDSRDQRDNRPISKTARDEVWILESVSEVSNHYNSERKRIEEDLEHQQDAGTRAIMSKRVNVLQRRQEFVSKIGRILSNVGHQLQLVEDTFGLINDEIRARTPDQIIADIDEVVVATETMSSALEEMAAVEQLMGRTG